MEWGGHFVFMASLIIMSIGIINRTVPGPHQSQLDNEGAQPIWRLPESRCCYYDWQLNPMMFSALDSIFGQHTMDRFSNTHSTHLVHFNWGVCSLDWSAGVDYWSHL